MAAMLVGVAEPNLDVHKKMVRLIKSKPNQGLSGIPIIVENHKEMKELPTDT